jgi:hypothetical protein
MMLFGSKFLSAILNAITVAAAAWLPEQKKKELDPLGVFKKIFSDYNKMSDNFCTDTIEKILFIFTVDANSSLNDSHYHK